MTKEYSWAQMLDEFRQLGGTAENIKQRAGPRGNGIFAVDSSRPVRIHAPAHLLIDTRHVVLDGVDLVVAPDAAVPVETRQFFARYQKHFSWGACGRSDADAFETLLREFPEVLLTRLKELALLDLRARHRGSWPEVLKTSFVNSRRIDFKDRNVLMPVVELVNHMARSPGFKVDDGVAVEGVFHDEVTVNYSASDSLRRFFTYGFVSQEPVAISLPIKFRVNANLQLEIRNLIDKFNRDGKLPLPAVEQKGGLHTLSHLRVGWEGSPRMPRTLMRKALADVAVDVVDEAFDRIRNANLTTLCDLLELADGTTACASFRRSVLCQIRALSHCHGVRTDAT